MTEGRTTTAFRSISVSREDRLTIIAIERPEARNALDADAQREMAQAFDDFAGDPAQWVAIVTGAGGRAFCAGHDLKQEAAQATTALPASGFGGLTSRLDLTKPVIAAVDGIAVGGGFELALACDIIVADESARFGFPEPRVGLAALAGGAQRLAREIGLKKAMGLLLTGRLVDAREGAALGFVNEVSPDGAMIAARRWAAQITACSPMSVRATKEVAMRSLSIGLAEALDSAWSWPAAQAMFASDDAIEGPRAFAEKRARCLAREIAVRIGARTQRRT